MESGPGQGSGQTAGSLLQDVEKNLVDLVKERRKEVERLEKELEVMKAHCDYFFKRFSVPTFPLGYSPNPEWFESRPELLEVLQKKAALAPGLEEDLFMPTGLPDGEAGDEAKDEPCKKSLMSTLNQVATSSHHQNLSGEANNGEGKEDCLLVATASYNDVCCLKSPAKIEKITEASLSSSSVSLSSEGTKGIDWSDGNAVDILKEEIRRERPGLKSPAKGFKKISLSPRKRAPEPESSIAEFSTGSEASSSEDDESELPCRSGSEDSSSEDDEAEPPSSSGSDTSMKHEPIPMRSKRSVSGEFYPTVTWQPTKKAQSNSSDSDDSSSSEDESNRKRWYSQTEKTFISQARAASTSALSLSPDASPEDLFDWALLGLKGPWMPLTSAEGTTDILKPEKQSPTPFKFLSMSSYVATFQKLIVEEAKAQIASEWEQYKAEQDENASGRFCPQDSRGLSSQWQLRSMLQTAGDPFHYIEADWVKKANWVKRPILDAGEFLCMLIPKTKEVKALAVVHYEDQYRAPLLRTRTAWDSSLCQCVLLRLSNTINLRRMFLAVSTLSEVSSPMQRQILDPMVNLTCMMSQPTPEDALNVDSNVKLKAETLKNYSARKILNSMQLLTISALLSLRQGFQLVQGPPGTGKTSTIVGMVSTILIEEPGVRVLVCAPSNAAIDEITARLMHRMLDKSGNPYSPMDGALVRFGSKRIMHPLVQRICLDNLALRLSSTSKRSRPGAEILNGASVVCATLSGCGNTLFDELEHKFDIVIIDEAAQAVEAEVLIALKRSRGRCVMVGDPKQLPATVFQRPSTAYGRSLFERFQQGGLPVYLLTTQYRMHPSISLYPSQQFYNGALIDSLRTVNMPSIFNSEVCDGHITIQGCKFKLGHYCFMDVGWGIEREEMVGHSRANFEEALVVCNVVEGVVKGLVSGVKPNLGIITPYIAQRGVIEGQLEMRGIDSAACEVNTVDGFQGREKDVIVLSCVRAMADKGLGFVSDERRMNVALTRAKYSLIIVGHAKTLQKWSPAWGALIDDARKRGCYQVLVNNKIQDLSAKDWKHRNVQKCKRSANPSYTEGNVDEQNDGIKDILQIKLKKPQSVKESEKSMDDKSEDDLCPAEKKGVKGGAGEKNARVLEVNRESNVQKNAIGEEGRNRKLVSKHRRENMEHEYVRKEKKRIVLEEISPEILTTKVKKKKLKLAESPSEVPAVKKKKKRAEISTEFPVIENKADLERKNSSDLSSVKKKKLKVIENPPESSAKKIIKLEVIESTPESHSVKKIKKLKAIEGRQVASSIKIEVNSEVEDELPSVKQKVFKSSPKAKEEFVETPSELAAVKKKKKRVESPTEVPSLENKADHREKKNAPDLPSVKKKKLEVIEKLPESSSVKLEVIESTPELRSVKKIKKLKANKGRQVASSMKREVKSEVEDELPSVKQKVFKSSTKEHSNEERNEMDVECRPQSPAVTCRADKQKEVIVFEVTSTALGGDRTRGDSAVDRERGHARYFAQQPRDPKSQSWDNWRDMRDVQQSRECFPTSQARHSETVVRPCFSRKCHGSDPMRPEDNPKYLDNGQEWAEDIQQPHWGNAYGEGRGRHHYIHSEDKEEIPDYNSHASLRKSYYADKSGSRVHFQHDAKQGNNQQQKYSSASSHPSYNCSNHAATYRGQSRARRRPKW